jgi:hypothetical protein
MTLILLKCDLRESQDKETKYVYFHIKNASHMYNILPLQDIKKNYIYKCF